MHPCLRAQWPHGPAGRGAGRFEARVWPQDLETQELLAPLPQSAAASLPLSHRNPARRLCRQRIIDLPATIPQQRRVGDHGGIVA